MCRFELQIPQCIVSLICITEYPSFNEFIAQFWPDLVRNAFYKILLNIWTILITKDYIIFENVDLSFKSRTRQGRHVNSHPPGGVDLCQL